MNNDENNEAKKRAELELEARIVAWISGEASEAEAAELAKRVAENPELAVFKRRIEAVRDLVAEAVSEEKEPLRISDVKRKGLLRALGATMPASSAKEASPMVLPIGSVNPKVRRQRQWILALAACLVAGLFLSQLVPHFGLIRRERPLAESMVHAELPELEARQKSVAVSMPTLRDTEEFQKAKIELTPPRIVVPEQFAVANSIEEKQAEAPATVNPVVSSTAVRWGGIYHFPNVPSEDSTTVTTTAATPSPGEETTVLNPFEVGMSDNKDGQKATSTLASTRVRTDLNDVASSISVVTKQFLKDTGAVNSQDLLTYTPDTELAGLQGNFTTPAGSAQSNQTVSDLGAVSPYHATSTLKSVRIRTNLDDLAASLPVLSRQFLDETAGNTTARTDSNDINYVLIDPAKAGFGSPVVFGAVENAAYSDRKIVNDLPNAAPPVPANVSEPLAKAAPETPAPKVAAPFVTEEVQASKEPVSTFSMHVSDASFELAKAALAAGQVPDPAGIRPEEFYNAFDYGDPEPAMSEKVACRIEQAADPTKQQRNLVRIALRVPSQGRDNLQPLRLTVLLDTSGSMEREDRAAAVRRAIQVLVSLLGPADQVTLVGFARQPHVLAQRVPGDKAGVILDLATHTPAEGGTNLEEALRLGGQLAQAQFDPSAQNRIVLMTDGAANLGNADPAALALAVDALRQSGISFDACGVGTGGVDDDVLEALSRKGSGRYYVLNSAEDADAGFAKQLAGAFRPAAVNVKVQVRFNPARVGAYRLVGFQHHRLATEDFRNDAVAAAALARGEAAVAMYEVEPLPQGEGELGEVYVRFRDTATDTMVERSWTLMFDPAAPALERSSSSLQLSGTAMLLAEKLQGGTAGAAVRLSQLVPEMNAIRSRYAGVKRVQDFEQMFEEARRLNPE